MSIRIDVGRQWFGSLMDVDKAGRVMPKTHATTVHRRSRKWRLMRRKWNREHDAIVRRLRKERIDGELYDDLLLTFTGRVAAPDPKK